MEGAPGSSEVGTFDGDFTITLWMNVPSDRAGSAGGLASKFDAATRTGFALSAISSAGGYNGPGDELRLSFGIDAGTEPEWSDLGRPSPVSNYVSNSLTVFDGSLFAATSDAPSPADRGHVYRHVGGATWEDCGKVPKEDAHGVGPLIVHQGSLYAAAWNYDWTRVFDQDLQPCHVYRFQGGTRWEDCGQPGRSKRLFGLGSYRGELFVVGDDWTVHVYRGDRTWEQVIKFGTYAHPLTVHDGVLYLGTLDPAAVWSFDGSRWSDLGNPMPHRPGACTQIHSLLTFRGELHLGSWPLGRVVRRDEAARSWRDVASLGDASEINGLAVYNGKLYGGTIPRAEVFRHEPVGRWTSIRRFFAPPGWQPVLVRGITTPAGFERHREWARVTSLTQHDGQLVASIASCTSAATDAPADIRGTVHAMRTGVVATTNRAIESGWRHVAAIRRGGRLSIYVDGHLAATAAGAVTGSVASEAPYRTGSDETGPYRGELRQVQAMAKPLDEREIARLAVGGLPG